MEKENFSKSAPDPLLESNDVKKTIILITTFLILTIVPVILASISNTYNYYIRSSEGAVEIWKGRFSPIGRKLLLTLPGAQAPETIKDVYTKEEISPFVFNYYMEKADALLNIAGMPDFDGIRSDLNKALVYAGTKELRDTANARLNAMDLAFLLFKAEVSESKGTLAGYESAINYLEKASQIDLDKPEAEMVQKKIEIIKKQMVALEEKEVKNKK